MNRPALAALIDACQHTLSVGLALHADGTLNDAKARWLLFELSDKLKPYSLPPVMPPSLYAADKP